MILQSLTLKVSNIPLLEAFYTKNFGFLVLDKGHHHVSLGTHSKVLLTLMTDSYYQRPTEVEVGMYHVAFLFFSKQAFANQLAHLLALRTPLTGLSDHGVSEAIYLSDPEDNGIEHYLDRPSSLWPRRDGQLTMITERMEYQPYLAMAKPFEGVDPGLILGHLHMHAHDLEKSRRFYQRALGMDMMQAYGEQALFLSYHQYHHHLGVNTWLGEDAGVLNPQSTGYASSTWKLEPHETLDTFETTFKAMGYTYTKEKERLMVLNEDHQTFIIVV